MRPNLRASSGKWTPVFRKRSCSNKKIERDFEAGAGWLAGASPASIIGRYREHVAANARRLSAG
jgi:hypothetical protein